jgi:hypothetical protein
MVRILQDDFQPHDEPDDSSQFITEEEIVNQYDRETTDAMLAYRRHHEDGDARYWTLDVANDLLGLIDWEGGPP